MPRIQHKRGTSANLASVNPTPLAGELVWDSTENAIKIGDGSTAWTSLAYVTATPRSHNHDDRYYTETEVDNLLAGKAASSHTHTFSQISDITFPSPLENNSIVVYTAGVGWGVANDIGTIGVGSQPLGGWPAGSVGASLAGKVDTSDSRLTDARTPTAHKSSHATGGSDALTPADIGAAPAASPTFTGGATFATSTLVEVSSATGRAAPVPTEIRIATTSAGSDWSTADAWGRLGFYSADTSGNGPATQASVDAVSTSTAGATSNLVFRLWNGVSLATRGTITSTGLDIPGVITVAATSGSAGSYAPSLTFSGDANTGFGQVSGQSDTASIFTAGHERVRVDSSGRVGIGVTPSSGNLIQYGRDISGGTGINGFIWASTIRSDVTSSANVFRTFVGTENVSFTLTTLSHFRASQNTFGASSTVATQVGFLCDAVSGGTNNYGFQGLLSSGTGRYNLYMSGTADNFINGDVGIKAAPPTAALDINSDKIRLRTAKTPASASDTGNAGDICWDADYVYICVSSNSWKRASLASW